MIYIIFSYSSQKDEYKMILSILSFLGLSGFLVTLYAIYVEKYAKTKNFKAICDIGKNASCSLVLTSPYAKLAKMHFNLANDSLFNQPNTYYGLLYYLAVFLYPLYPFTLVPCREAMLLINSIMAVSMSVFLGWILYNKLKNFCGVCAVTYVINMVIMIYSFKEFVQP